MTVSVKRTEQGGFSVGGDPLNQEALEALSEISVSAEDVLEHMEALNEELSENFTIEKEEEAKAQTLPEVKVPQPTGPPKKKTGTRMPATRHIPRSIAKDRELAASDPPPREANMQPSTDNISNLDDELDALTESLDTRTAAATEEAALGGDMMRDQILELLENTPGAPSQAQINQWKAQYGVNGVHVMALGEGDIYIFTHLKRGQWKKIQELTAKAQETQATDVEDMLKEKVIQYATLWPKPLSVEFFYNSRAGVVDSLYQVILLNSYFLSPQQAMLLTTQL